MPWRTLGYITLAILVVLFIAFNLNNVTDISFIFFTVRDVPVFFTVFLSVIIGCLIMLPVSLRMNRSPRKKKSEDDEIPLEQLLESDSPAEEKKRDKRRGKKKNKDLYGEPEEISDLDIR